MCTCLLVDVLLPPLFWEYDIVPWGPPRWTYFGSSTTPYGRGCQHDTSASLRFWKSQALNEIDGWFQPTPIHDLFYFGCVEIISCFDNWNTGVWCYLFRAEVGISRPTLSQPHSSEANAATRLQLRNIALLDRNWTHRTLLYCTHPKQPASTSELYNSPPLASSRMR